MKTRRSLRVVVYFNLHHAGYSIRVGGKVIAHSQELLLLKCKFKVSKAGRERVLREKKRNVHAVVEGDLLFDPVLIKHFGEGLTRQVSYNPYRADHFTDQDGSPVFEADAAWFKDGKVYVE